ncbi:hypothetical protein EV424DRAFT_1545318 [Suillus variegatus]|nr:hypothetical protein EV424DRAFT_1545318 [Suillus variegatus]
MSHPASTETNYPCIQRALGLADMASIFEFATSRLLAIWMTLNTGNLVTSSKVQYILTRYLMWEGDVTGCIVRTYPMAWWNQAFDTVDYQTFTTTLPNFNDIKAMVNSHFEQLPEGHLLVMLVTLVDSRSTPVVQQLANIHTGIKQEGDQIITLLENKVVEVRLVVASLLRMETALGQDVRAAIAATERLVKCLKKEGQQAMYS